MSLLTSSPSLDAADRREAAVRDVASRLFAEPDRLIQTLTHAISDRFIIAPHAHDDVLQFDLLVGCAGRAWSDGRATAITGTTALVARPGEMHGYELEPESLTPGEVHPGALPGALPGGAGRVYHFKLRVERNWPMARWPVFPPLVTGLGGMTSLTAALRGAMRLGMVEGLRPPLLMVRLTEALCLWPTGRGGEAAMDPEAGAGAGAGEDDAEIDRRMAEVFELIERRLADPPRLEELARTAHFSPRHFVRRFRRRYGCTPLTYLTARRFALARQMLTQDQLKIRQIADALGFGSVATFSRWFTQHAGRSPSDYRQDPTVM